MHPANLHKIYARYNEDTIRVYQAYGDAIANEALQKGTFGDSFKLERMTWIKPSFLWMMYRSGWGTKEGQTRVLAIDMKRTGFDEILSQAVQSSFSKEAYSTREEWQKAITHSDTNTCSSGATRPPRTAVSTRAASVSGGCKALRWTESATPAPSNI